MRRVLTRSLLASAALLAIAACGGGGGGGSTPAPSGPSGNQNPGVTKSYLNGQAATGAPVALASVTGQCASGAALSGATDADGKWSLELSNQAFPCLVTVSGATLPAGQSLYSVALDKSSALNVTPLTTLVTASAAQALPSALAGNATALAAAAQALGTGLANVNASLKSAGYTTVDGDPLTAAFKPQAGDAHDDLIESLTRSLKDESQSLQDLATAFAGSAGAEVPVPNTHVFSAAELTASAMPQLNNASLAVNAGVLDMTLASGTSAVGTFVGGGNGNKAVLQLPGLTGTKLKDLKDITMQLSGPSTATNGVSTKNVYAYMNFTVDLDCSATPLDASATLADVRARRRIFIYDPYVNFIQQAPSAISATELSTIKFSRSTPGWRVSAGTSVGTGVAINPAYIGNETLDGFDFANHPNACIVDGVTGDGGMFRDKDADPSCNTSAALNDLAHTPAKCGKPYRGAIVVLGDSGTDVPVQWKLKKVRVNTTSPRNFVFE